MTKKTFLISVMVLCGLISGCAQNTLDAPCPDFGRSCAQLPINSWNFNN